MRVATGLHRGRRCRWPGARRPRPAPAIRTAARPRLDDEEGGRQDECDGEPSSIASADMPGHFVALPCPSASRLVARHVQQHPQVSVGDPVGHNPAVARLATTPEARRRRSTCNTVVWVASTVAAMSRPRLLRTRQPGRRRPSSDARSALRTRRSAYRVCQPPCTSIPNNCSRCRHRMARRSTRLQARDSAWSFTAIYTAAGRVMRRRS